MARDRSSNPWIGALGRRADEEAGDGLHMFGVEVTETRTYRKLLRAENAEGARIKALEEFKEPASFEMLSSRCDIGVDPDKAHEWEGSRRMAEWANRQKAVEHADLD